MSDATALYLIKDAVMRRPGLIFGQLEARGEYCAIGAFWHEHPGVTLHTTLVDEVAAVNDSIPKGASEKTRKRKVLDWLRFRLRTLQVARNG